MDEHPVFDADDPQVRSRHLLALPPNVEPDELEVLAVSRFGRVRWEEEPAAEQPRTGLLPAVSAAFGMRRVAPAAMPRLRLGRLSSLVGPYALEPSRAVALGLPTSSSTIWVLHAPTERGEAPWPGPGDRDGMNRAFPHGEPVREEARVVRWAVAAARRLGGSVRIGDSGAVITPDPDAAVDLTVFTDVAPTPELVLGQVRQVLPRARPSGPVTTAPWAGPVVDRHPRGRHARRVGPVSDPREATVHRLLDAYGVADDAARAELHARADAFDAEIGALPSVGATFGVEADLDLDGDLEVLVEPALEVPSVLRDAPWAQPETLVALHVRWFPEDREQAEVERPSALHRVARGRASTLVNAIAVALWDVLGGEIADEAEFLVHPDDLRRDL